jgi:hypothetical protein
MAYKDKEKQRQKQHEYYLKHKDTRLLKMTQKELYEKYLSDLVALQKECKHEKESDWLEEQWAPAHTTGRIVKVCECCGVITEFKELII